MQSFLPFEVTASELEITELLECLDQPKGLLPKSKGKRRFLSLYWVGEKIPYATAPLKHAPEAPQHPAIMPPAVPPDDPYSCIPGELPLFLHAQSSVGLLKTRV